MIEMYYMYISGHWNIRDSKLGEKRQLHTGVPKWSTKGTEHEARLFLSHIIDILDSISVKVQLFSELCRPFHLYGNRSCQTIKKSSH